MAIHKPAGFFALPPEMRNYIYKLSFGGTFTGVDVQADYLIPTDLAVTVKAPCHVQGLNGIFNANNQTRSEAIGIFFATTTFFFASGVYLLWWFRRLPRAISCAVKRVCLQIEVNSSSRGNSSYDSRDAVYSQMHKAEMMSWVDYLESKRQVLGRADFEPSVRFWGTVEGRVIWPKKGAEKAT